MKDAIYSIRLKPEMKEQLKAWASEEDRKLAYLIVRILDNALAERSARHDGSDLPEIALQHQPTPATAHASQAENVC